MKEKNVCIVGMGYVGLTLAVVMAEHDYNVVGVEINEETLLRLQSGKPHFYELGLEARMKMVQESGALKFVKSFSGLEDNIYESFILTVGTPLDEKGDPRMDMVQRASKQVSEFMQDGAMIILRSTVRMGTTRKIVEPILKESNKRFDLAYCPERTIEGNALAEIVSLPQIIGGLTPQSAWRATTLFQYLTPTTIRVSSLEAAEAIKLLDNSYRDLFFSFGNEVALLCDSAGLNGVEVISAANRGYSRTNIANPGFVGGPCLEKDPHILQHSLRDFNFVPQLIKSGRTINEELPQNIIDMILAEDKLQNIKNSKVSITICGLAFKGVPETDDLRGTPAMYLIDALRRNFDDVNIYGQDFAVTDDNIKDIGLKPVNIDGAYKNKNIVIIANNNKKYRSLNLVELSRTMDEKALIFDVWNVLPTYSEDASHAILRCLGSARYSRNLSNS